MEWYEIIETDVTFKTVLTKNKTRNMENLTLQPILR
jgi:hypothetical protein